MNLEEKILLTKQRIIKVLEEHKNVALAYSGGKDSTALLLIALDIIEKCSEGELHIIHCDTLVENLAVRDHCDKFLSDLSEYVKEKNLPVRVHVARPSPNSTFWVNLIGKGYPLPYYKFRWCQKDLKVEPAQKLIKKIGVGIVLTAIRMEESQARKQSIKKNYDGTERKKGLRAVAPMMEWTTEDVWEFLTSYDCKWTNLLKVYELYREASGECPLLVKGTSTVCGARFGCWVCTLASDDRAMKNLSSYRIGYYSLYLFRKWLIEFCAKSENRTGKSRSGKNLGEGKGQLTLTARKILLDKLLELEISTGFKLLQDWELDIIKKKWENEYP